MPGKRDCAANVCACVSAWCVDMWGCPDLIRFGVALWICGQRNGEGATETRYKSYYWILPLTSHKKVLVSAATSFLQVTFSLKASAIITTAIHSAFVEDHCCVVPKRSIVLHQCVQISWFSRSSWNQSLNLSHDHSCCKTFLAKYFTKGNVGVIQVGLNPMNVSWTRIRSNFVVSKKLVGVFFLRSSF